MNWPLWSRRRPIVLNSMSDTCHSIEPLLSLYVDGMAAVEERRRVEAHLPLCADCRAELAWMQATHQTLAARPIMTPPADLHARIAEAIATSAAAPIRLRPARAFTLRPAYAAAASLTILGAVLSVTLMHTLSSVPPNSSVGPHTLPAVAVKPRATIQSAVKHVLVIASSHHSTLPHLTVRPTASVTEHLASNPRHPRVLLPLPEPMQDRQVATVVRTAPAVSFVKSIVHPKLHSETASQKMASRSVGIEPKSVSLPRVTLPKPHAPIMEAALPKSPPTVSVNIGPAMVTTQSDAPRVHMASDIMGDVRTSAIHLRNEGFATVMKSANHTALDMNGSNLSDGHFYPTVYGPIH
jgi:hypothetical protein